MANVGACVLYIVENENSITDVIKTFACGNLLQSFVTTSATK